MRKEIKKFDTPALDSSQRAALLVQRSRPHRNIAYLQGSWIAPGLRLEAPGEQFAVALERNWSRVSLCFGGNRPARITRIAPVQRVVDRAVGSLQHQRP